MECQHPTTVLGFKDPSPGQPNTFLPLPAMLSWPSARVRRPGRGGNPITSKPKRRVGSRERGLERLISPLSPAVVRAGADNLSHILTVCQLGVKKKKIRRSCLLIQLAGLFIRAGLAGAVRRPGDACVWAVAHKPCRHVEAHMLALRCEVSHTSCVCHAWSVTRKPINCNEILGWEDALNMAKLFA